MRKRREGGGAGGGRKKETPLPGPCAWVTEHYVRRVTSMRINSLIPARLCVDRRFQAIEAPHGAGLCSGDKCTVTLPDTDMST